MESGSGNCWKLEGNIGRLNSPALACNIDIAHPTNGLCDVTLRGASLDGTLLSIRRDTSAQRPADLGENDWPASLTDAYVRGNDVVASYSATDRWPYAPQVYWRAAALDSVPGVIGSLGVLISVQTHLLETYPEISIRSRLIVEDLFEISAPADEAEDPVALRLEEHQKQVPGTTSRCLLWRLQDSRISYVEIMPGSDFRELIIERHEDGTSSAKWRIFADFLEKGVIRRARLQSAFLPRADDVARAAACKRALERRPLPLTA